MWSFMQKIFNIPTPKQCEKCKFKLLHGGRDYCSEDIVVPVSKWEKPFVPLCSYINRGCICRRSKY